MLTCEWTSTLSLRANNGSLQTCSISWLGADEQHRQHRKAKRLGGLEMDDQFVALVERLSCAALGFAEP
jgi:hypothetical protein